ncbi:hypothetical protein ACCAA_1150020 [Candidatus Accumulibacter aalborgensis]|uniref:Uncharacterized protein n=1 Tax=Candidatus Accumulibacter aalborgensis TaxID=1860102 RepID=A0A1A8XIP5_9PROT|nr:hypothetical protein ACCAA_1150020 [Candidatus Accumulibacter aalborgensis]
MRQLALQAERAGDGVHRVNRAGAGGKGVSRGGERTQHVDHYHGISGLVCRVKAIQEEAAGTHGGGAGPQVAGDSSKAPEVSLKTASRSNHPTLKGGRCQGSLHAPEDALSPPSE